MNSIQETLKDTNVGEIMSYCIYYMYIVSIQHVIFKIVCLRYSTNKKLKLYAKIVKTLTGFKLITHM